mmetsp:Transcript_47975/g.96768  ORF Transcript_47975/g.96768 Transcript_47975/m.96768 type:complete len:115 (-) Transcript_47975:186-530(-)
MAYGVLFGSRILPQAAQRFSRTAAPTFSGLTQRAFAAGTPALRPATNLLASGRTASVLGAQQGLGLSVRSYGTRSLWNVKSGKFWLFAWVVPATLAAFVMQEVAGPYVFFHEWR